MMILLDIDGVMVPAKGWQSLPIAEDSFVKFADKAILNLKRIIYETNAAIVLTTSHRSRYSVPQWKDIFSSRGIDALIFKLEDSNLSKKEDILKFIKDNQPENYVIVDDDTMLNDLPKEIKGRLVLTKPMIGLDKDSTDSILKLLK